MSDGDITVSSVYHSLTDNQKKVVHYLVGSALSGRPDGSEPYEIRRAYLRFSDIQRGVTEYLIEAAKQDRKSKKNG
jgi:uncharacterized protein (UPF0297 family)